ncbi:MAG: transposase [Ktedonobacteraceae bacterium]
MYFQYGTDTPEKQPAEEESQWWAEQLETYLAPYRERLDAYLDRRVVGNLTATVAGIVQTRSEVTTSALGRAICGPEQGEAGTQRLQRALHHQGWEAKVIEAVLWDQAETRRQAMEERGETPLCIWDSSVLEKPESAKLEGLGSVRSSRVRRLARSRAGVFNRPSGMPVSVRGFEWESLLLVGQEGRPQVVAMRWWGREKGVVGQQRQQQQALLSQAARRWGRQVRHVFDRGYGSGPWLWQLWRHQLRFVVRWKKGNQLRDATGHERKAWEIARGKRAWGKEAKLLWDTHFRVYRSTRVLALPVGHPEYQGQLWLVVVRQGKGREPWYVLTNEPVETEEQAWEIAFSYVSRWKIEESFRFQKTELLIESLRLRAWEPRRKLLLLVTLAYGFLLWVLAPGLFLARSRLLVHWNPRADWRQWNAKLPVYRLRWALSRLWLSHPPSFVESGWRPYRPLSHLTWPPCSLRWWMTLWHQSGYLF